MMASNVERIGIVETKVENLNQKLDELKIDVKDMHDCLDKTRDDLKEQLTEMYDASCNQHSSLAKEISELKSQRDKWIWTSAGIIAAIGWVSGHMGIIAKIFN
jgi:flagellar capping protein FliD